MKKLRYGAFSPKKGMHGPTCLSFKQMFRHSEKLRKKDLNSALAHTSSRPGRERSNEWEKSPQISLGAHSCVRNSKRKRGIQVHPAQKCVRTWHQSQETEKCVKSRTSACLLMALNCAQKPRVTTERCWTSNKRTAVRATSRRVLGTVTQRLSSNSG